MHVIREEQTNETTKQKWSYLNLASDFIGVGYLVSAETNTPHFLRTGVGRIEFWCAGAHCMRFRWSWDHETNSAHSLQSGRNWTVVCVLPPSC